MSPFVEHSCGPHPVPGLYSGHLFEFPPQPQVAGLVLSFLLNKEVQRSSVTPLALMVAWVTPAVWLKSHTFHRAALQPSLPSS